MRQEIYDALLGACFGAYGPQHIVAILQHAGFVILPCELTDAMADAQPDFESNRPALRQTAARIHLMSNEEARQFARGLAQARYQALIDAFEKEEK